jgi:hypothetical protein
LNGLNVEDRLLQIELPNKIVVSKKPDSNFRNKELNIER